MHRLVFTALLVASTVTAQIYEGCPGFARPTWTGQANLGQTITFDLLGRPAPRSFTFLALGFCARSAIPFSPPFTCHAGPCNLYIAPAFGGDYLTVADPFHAVMVVPIPNDRALRFSTWCVQGGFFSGIGNCIDFSAVLLFTIQP